VLPGRGSRDRVTSVELKGDASRTHPTDWPVRRLQSGRRIAAMQGVRARAAEMGTDV